MALGAAGYSGGYAQLTAWLRKRRQAAGAAVSTAAFVPLKFGPGEAFRFDWSDEQLLIGGLMRRVQLSHLKLCASRAFFLEEFGTCGRMGCNEFVFRRQDECGLHMDGNKC